MTAELVDGYLFYVDDELAAIHDTLEEAQKIARQYMSNHHSLRIMYSPKAMAITRNWNYAYDIEQWVELVR